MTQLDINTTNNYQQLSEAERGAIQAYHEEQYSIREIARKLNRNPSTISRELKRGTVRQLNSDYLPHYQYFADSGQAYYLKHRANCHSKGLLNRCWLFFSMRVGQNMVNFRALRQIGTVIRFWITIPIWFKRKKLCFAARLCCKFNEYDSYVPNS